MEGIAPDDFRDGEGQKANKSCHVSLSKRVYPEFSADRERVRVRADFCEDSKRWRETDEGVISAV